MCALDIYDLWEAHEREQQRQLERLPVCVHCGREIQDEKLFDFNGDIYHVSCAEEEFKKDTEDYIE